MIPRLENQSSTLGLLVTTQLEVLATLQGQLQLGLALRALETQDNLLGGLGLLVEDGLRLTTVSGLLAVLCMNQVSACYLRNIVVIIDVGRHRSKSRRGL